MKKLLSLVLLGSLLSFSLRAQEKEHPVTIGGYASWLHNSMFDSINGNWINSGILHNRINMKVYAGNKLTFGLEVRNRFITGDLITLDPFYSISLDSDPGWADLSWNIIDEQAFIYNSMIDRIWVDFTSGKFQVTVGRQRINWSQSLVWNPNDIFNTYSFFDFDYVERPGSDAVRIVFSATPSSAAEIAVKANSEGNVTAAALYRFSLLNTDIQFLAGETDEESFFAGTGWSGAIGPYSVRGEATWFQPFESDGLKEGTGIATIGVDRMFSDKVNVIAQVMYCNKPLALNFFNDLYSGGMTASELAFSEFTAMGQITYTPMPLLNISGSAIWYPDMDGFFAGPSIDVSLAENVDFSFVWQHFKSTIGGSRTRVNLGFLRFKYSF